MLMIGVRKDVDGRKIWVPAPRKESGEGEEQTEIQMINDLDARNHFLPKRKSMHADS